MNKLNLTKLKKYIFRLLFLVVGVQLIFWPSVDGVICGFLNLIGVIFGCSYILRRKLLLICPISSSIILGYILYYFILPPIATLAESKELINNLEYPVLVFLNSVVCLFFIILSHSTYRNSRILMNFRGGVTKYIYQPLQYFHVPSNAQLLIMGVIGLIAMASQIFISGAARGDANSSSDKLMQGFYPLAYIPYCILIKNIIGGRGESIKKWMIPLTFYSMLLLVVALGRNSRSAIFLGLMSVFLAYVYAILSGLILVKRKFSMKKIIVGTVVAVLILGPVTDLALSMVIARTQRTDVTPVELVLETASVYQDGNISELTRLLNEKDYVDWDEGYVDNIFLSRLSNLKFSDNSIGLAINLGPAQVSKMISIEWSKVVSILPSPIILLLALDVDKELVTSGSGGDFLYAVGGGDTSAIGGFRTGSIFGSGYVLFGFFYPVVFSLILLISFPLIDASVLVRKSILFSYLNEFNVRPVFNSLVVANFFSWVFYLTSAATGVESVSELMNYLFRGWIQALLVYFFAYWMSYFLMVMLGKRTD